MTITIELVTALCIRPVGRNLLLCFLIRSGKKLLRFLPVCFNVFEDVEIGLDKFNFSI